jgi:tol-pal system protein YbgF
MIPLNEGPKRFFDQRNVRVRKGVGVLLLSMLTLTTNNVESQTFGDILSLGEQGVPETLFLEKEKNESFHDWLPESSRRLVWSTENREFVLSRPSPEKGITSQQEAEVWLSVQVSSHSPSHSLGLSKSRSLSPTVVFNAAYSDFLKGRYVLAISAFQQFLQDFPSSSRVDQVHFYLGESYYYSGKVPAAARTFKKLLEDFPRSRYGPSALLKLGHILAQGGKPEKAKKVWLLVIKKFPRSPESQLAQQQLLRHP